MGNDIQTYVDNAMQWALSNGYSFTDWTANDIAHDLIAYDPDIGDVSFDELLPCAADWKRRHPHE